ncbi:MAG: phosphoribosylglycinamide formyltransferase 2 [Thermoplasmata archaeon]|jgi:phosphoribosylglycinamide formyltransferase 2|nr:phosphoribosylglycinamide formyltransferase 2 [Thermoplasmata archaeon]
MLGTPLSPSATKILLLGSGELGKEVAIEAMRLGCEVIACDRYANAPAMQVAHRSRVFSMLDGAAIRRAVEEEKPHLIVPEIEAIATDALLDLEKEGWRVIPTARAARLTMDREGIRRLAAEELGLPTSSYRFASTYEEMAAGAKAVGFPCVVKPTMSSSGKGQSVVRGEADLRKAWDYAMTGTRASTGRVIVEGFVRFDYEITLLTVRHAGGTSFCAPIGHVQVDGDYRESWQPMAMTAAALSRSQDVARRITDALGGRGVFGVELFVAGDQVWFSEVSPRPHDTGMVTMASQTMSEFELHVRAILGLPIPAIECRPGASAAILSEVDTQSPAFEGVEDALAEPGTWVRIFGKPSATAKPPRRMGVALATGATVEDARRKAMSAAKMVRVRDGR